MKKIVKVLTEKKKTISTMESCTGGLLASKITDVAGASEVLKFSAVTYCNEYKIKMGVSSETINKYSVYSIETAREMARNISLYANSNYGIGITGKLNRADIHNKCGNDSTVYFSIYDKDNNKYYDSTVIVTKEKRKDNKELIVNRVKEIFISIIT